jgi:hypothetical protein
MEFPEKAAARRSLAELVAMAERLLETDSARDMPDIEQRAEDLVWMLRSCLRRAADERRKR